MRSPDNVALAALYRELGFSSLLKELGAEAAPAPAVEGEAAAKKDYAQFSDVKEFSAWLEKLPAKAPVAVWLQLESGDREAEGFGTRISGIEVSSKPGEGRAVWMDEKGEALKALAPALGNSKRAKIVHDPKLFQLLTGRAEHIQDATQIYSERPGHGFGDSRVCRVEAGAAGRSGQTRATKADETT